VVRSWSCLEKKFVIDEQWSVVNGFDAHPSMDGTIFPSWRCVFGAWLTFENCAIGHRVCVRSPDRPFEEAGKARGVLQNALLFVVDVQNVEGLRVLGEAAAPCAKQAAQYRRGKRVEEKSHTWTRRQLKLCGIAAEHPHGCNCATCFVPQGSIVSPYAREEWMEFNPNHAAKGVGGCEEHGAAHACAEIDKCVLVDGRERPASPPTNENALKDRGSDCVVGGDMAIVTASGAEVAPGNKAARTNSKLQVEWMPNQAILDRQARQEMRLGSLSFFPIWRTNAHA
jgi:hypothetical protein